MTGPDFFDEMDCGSFFDDLFDYPTEDVENWSHQNEENFPTLCLNKFSDSFPRCDSIFSGNNSASDISVEHSVPYEDMLHLEWLSNFVEDSFSSPVHVASNNSIISKHMLHPNPVRARTKRPRPVSFNPRTHFTLMPIKPAKESSKKMMKAEVLVGVRKCMHCEVTKTPQWRAGPTGAKTLCNACGVRYNKGRLFPEYRPAASPTFVNSMHSNSHKKVLEMRKNLLAGTGDPRK